MMKMQLKRGAQVMYRLRSLSKVTIGLLLTLILVVLTTVLALRTTADVSADTVNTFSGIAKDSAGNNLTGSISLKGTTGTFQSVIASDGSFSVAAAPGLYSLTISGGMSSGVQAYPSGKLYAYTLSQPLDNPTIDLTSNSITQNLTMPVSKVNFIGYNNQGYPQNESSGWITAESTTLANPVSLYPGDPGATTISVNWNNARVLSTSTSYFTSITGVIYQPGNLCYRSSSTSGYSKCITNAYTVTGSASPVSIPQDPPAPYNFSGTLKGSDGTLMRGRIALTDAYSNTVQVDIPESGAFTVPVRPGMYRISSLSGWTNSSDPVRVATFAMSQSGAPSINLTTGNVLQDLTIPLSTINYFTNMYNPGTIQFNGTAPTVPYYTYPGDPGMTMSTSSVGMPKTVSGYVTGSFKVVTGTIFAPGSMCALQNPISAGVKYCALGGLTVGSGVYYVNVSSVPPVTQLTVQTPTVKPSLAWSPVTYASKYFIFRDGLEIAEVTGTTYMDNNVAVGSHEYYIIAADDTGTRSSMHAGGKKTVVVTAPEAPSTPQFKVQIAWGEVNGAASYNVYRDGVLIGNTSNLNFSDIETISATHSYYVKALNGHGDEGVASQTAQLSLTVQ